MESFFLCLKIVVVKVHVLKFSMASKSSLDQLLQLGKQVPLGICEALRANISEIGTFYVSDDAGNPDRLVSMAMPSSSLNLL